VVAVVVVVSVHDALAVNEISLLWIFTWFGLINETIWQ